MIAKFLAIGLGLLCATPASAQDAAAGQAVFQSQCALCHSVEDGVNRTGPSLFGIMGRQAGTAPGFTYSAAKSQSGMIWSRESLNLYVLNPHLVVPGNAMPYGGLADARQRADLIAYLATLR